MAPLPSAGEERGQPPSSYETAGYPAIGHDRGVFVRQRSIGCPVRPGITPVSGVMHARWTAQRVRFVADVGTASQPVTILSRTLRKIDPNRT